MEMGRDAMGFAAKVGERLKELIKEKDARIAAQVIKEFPVPMELASEFPHYEADVLSIIPALKRQTPTDTEWRMNHHLVNALVGMLWLSGISEDEARHVWEAALDQYKSALLAEKYESI